MKNFISETNERVKDYNEVFDKLLQDFRDRSIRDTLVVVHRIWEGMKSLEDLGKSFSRCQFVTPALTIHCRSKHGLKQHAVCCGHWIGHPKSLFGGDSP